MMTYGIVCASCHKPIESQPNIDCKVCYYRFLGGAIIMDGQELKTGVKKDEGKPRMDLISSIAITELAKVLTFGCGKYSPNNWRLGISWGRVIGACLRHIFSWMKGDDKDPETGLSHLAHAFCCLMFLLEYEITRKEFDDRYLPSK